jgi:signal transduction histidine kinase
LEEFAEMTILQIRPPDEVPLLTALMAGPELEAEAQGYWRHQKKDGTLISVEINAHGLNFDGREARLVIARDITDLRQAEDALRESEGRLRQSQKMEAVGQLAGGVAHDFNNLLTAILGYGEILTKRVAADPKSLRDVNEICKAGRRAASLTQQLLAFSRKQVLQPEVLALNAVVGGIEMMLQRLIGEDIELRTVLAKSQARVKADPGQIEQVILNLAVNARDAMPLGGRLLIETENADFDEDAARARGLSTGRYVALAVTDTGCGMDAATRAHIFEPFFTTKEVGKGTGLGLATVYGIVKQSGGQIGVESELGRGTTFKIYLPRVDDAADQGAPEISPLAVERGAETILVVEDDEAVLGLMCEILEATGYKVLVARNALQALSIYNKERVVDLVLTDLVMPNRSGLELTLDIRQVRPDAPVICMSGNAQNTLPEGGVETPTAFMQKPFTNDVLVRTVRSVLDAAA